MINIYLSIIIPVYNEEKRIECCLRKIEEYFSRRKYSYEVILFDDQSSDKSVEIIEKNIKNKSNYHLIKNHVNRGKGYGVKKGVEASLGKYILFTDTDLSTPIEDLDKLLVHINQFSVVIGSRYMTSGSIKIKQSFMRRLVSRLGNIAIRLILGLKYKDTQCGFKLFQSAEAKQIFSRVAIDRWGFDMEVLTIAKILNYQVKEVAVDWSDDKNSKLRAGRDAINTLKELIKIKINVLKKKYK